MIIVVLGVVETDSFEQVYTAQYNCLYTRWGIKKHMNGFIINTESEKGIKESRKKLKELRERNRRLPFLFL